jgi:hypothetical protein
MSARDGCCCQDSESAYVAGANFAGRGHGFGRPSSRKLEESARSLDAELCHASWTAVRGLATVLICTNRRLVSADDNPVAFLWKDYRIDRPDSWKTMTLHIAGLLFAHGHLGPQFYVPYWWSFAVTQP